MRRVVILPFVALGLAAAVALNLPAEADSKSYNFNGFEGVAVSAGVNVVLKQGPFSISATGSAKDLERLEIEKRGDVLNIGRKSSMGINWSSGQVVVTVTAPRYASIAASSGSDVDGANLSLEDSSVSVSSGADLDLKEVSAARLDITVSSGSDADMTGSCKSIVVDVSSGADFDGSGLKCETAKASASSGADVDIWASKSADGDASSGGDITFLGNPATRTEDTSSGGDVSFK
jgi:hypothetical protein